MKSIGQCYDNSTDAMSCIVFLWSKANEICTRFLKSLTQLRRTSERSDFCCAVNGNNGEF